MKAASLSASLLLLVLVACGGESPAPEPAPNAREGSTATYGEPELAPLAPGRPPDTWTFLRETYDANGDRVIAGDEYTRGAERFANLDRDGDGVLAPADFAVDARGRKAKRELRHRGRDLLLRAFQREPSVTRAGASAARAGTTSDADEHENESLDGGGREVEAPQGVGGEDSGTDPRTGDLGTRDNDAAGLTLSQLVLRFAELDRNGDGALDESELGPVLDALPAPLRAFALEDFPSESPFTFLGRLVDDDADALVERDELISFYLLLDQEEGAWNASNEAALEPTAVTGVPAGELAPDFTLERLDPADGGPVTLSSFRGVQPVALVFGSYTCPIFRASVERLKEVWRTHADTVAFFVVYVREAHAIDGVTPVSTRDAPVVELALTLADRRAAATTCTSHLALAPMPMLVDGMDDAVSKAYAGYPARLYLIDCAGRVAYRSPDGPHAVEPDHLDAAIATLLASERTHR